MRLAFLVPTAHDIGGTAHAAVSQANALVRRGHDVEMISVYRQHEPGHFPMDRRIRTRDLVEITEDRTTVHGLGDRVARALRRTSPLRIQPSEDPTLDALTDVALEEALPRLQADVLVTFTPALMAYGIQLAPPGTAVVHQEHRASSQRQSSRELLLHYARQADAVAMLTEPMAAWMGTELGLEAPELVVVPNAVPPGFRPRSMLTEPVIVSAGRFAWEKQWPQLIRAFGRIADEIPDWRLRIFGVGPARFEMRGAIRKLGLWDRVELPGSTQDMVSEWTRASIMALTSRPGEGFPLVIQEAMAAGVPVVAYDMPTGPRDQITDGVDGFLVTQGSVTGLSSALLRLATDPALRQQVGDAARAKAATWDTTSITDTWEALYERVAQRRAGAVGRSTAILQARGEKRAELLESRAVAAEAPIGVDPVTDPTPPPSLEPPGPDQAPPGREGTGLTPLQARSTALATAVALARSACEGHAEEGPWFVVPPHGDAAPVVVMPMTRRRAFLEQLATADLPPWLSVHDPDHRGWPSRRGTAAELVPPLLRGRTALLLLEPWPEVGRVGSLIGRDCGVEVQFWERGPEGDLHAPDPGGYTPLLHRDTELVDAEVLGTAVRTHPAMLLPRFTDVDFDVDVVYTWVDGNDPAWRAARAERLAGVGDATMLSRASSGDARYADRGELRWSMRGVHLFAPWVRTIHLVTDGQCPDWLDPDHPSVNLVHHREILPDSALPTFNSHAIEAALHRIDGLSEHFLYFNDDMFFGAPTVPEHYFEGSGQNAVFFSHTTVGLGERDLKPWQLAGGNNRRLLQEAFGRVVVQAMMHAPYAHRRSVLAEIAERFPAEVEATMHAPFRSATDLSMLSSFAQHYGLATGSAVPRERDFQFVDITDAHVAKLLRDLLVRDRAGFCLGDQHDFAREPAVVDRVVRNFLERYFPVHAPWERD